MSARLCHARLVPVGHKKQVEKPGMRGVIGVFYLLNPINSLTPKSVPAGTKLVLFGRYVLNIYVGIV